MLCETRARRERPVKFFEKGTYRDAASANENAPMQKENRVKVDDQQVRSGHKSTRTQSTELGM